MQTATVLVTTAGTATSLNVIRALRNQNELPIRIVGVDMAAAPLIPSARLCDAFYQVPGYSDPSYLEELIAVCKREGVEMLIPVNDGEVEAAARARDMLAQQGIGTLLAPPDVVAACNDKRQTYDLLCKYDVPTPTTWLPAELAAAGGPANWPVIIKPRRGIGAVDVYCAYDAEELAFFLQRSTDPIVQEYLPGDEYTVDVLADDTSRPLAVVPRLRLQTKAGVSTKGRTVYDEELIERTKLLSSAMGLRGPANVQWRRDGDRVGCFEINPRFSGALALSIAAGANTPLMLVRLLLGQQVEPVTFRPGVTMIRSWAEQFAYDEPTC